MKYCIIGGFGFVGNEVTRQLAALGEVCVIDSGFRVAKDIDDISHVQNLNIDIANGPAVDKAIGLLSPDVVVHLAAIHFIPECNANPSLTLRVNVEGTFSVLSACANHQVKHVLFASSGAVYADSTQPLSEQDAVEPIDIYGLSKKMAEDVCLLFAKSHRLPVSILRLFNVFGPRETNAHIIPEIIEQLRQGDVLRLGNIKPVRDYVFTTDVAEAIIRVAGRVPTGVEIFNVSSGYSSSVQNLIEIMGDILNRRIQVQTDETRYRKADKLVQRANIDKLMQVVGWRPSVNLEEGLRRLLAYEKLLF
ncbi:MAG: NAD-dependent epimerase/dehydratase family protein [Cytophagales bacterium]|nr:NAD-dependent epimerase/dehydratase family protein [Cytophagales bacterium]